MKTKLVLSVIIMINLGTSILTGQEIYATEGSGKSRSNTGGS
jgi:hypothetical protein